MKLDKHETIIKEKMRAFRPEPDKEALLQYLNHTVAVDNHRKKKRRLIFLLIFFIPLLIVGGLFILNKNEHDIEAKRYFDKMNHLNKQLPQNNNQYIKKSESTNNIIAKNIETDNLDFGKNIINNDQSILSKKQSSGLNKLNLSSQDKNISKIKEESGNKNFEIVKQNNSYDKISKGSILNRQIENIDFITIKMQTLQFDYGVLLKRDISKFDFTKYRRKSRFAVFMSTGSGWFTHNYIPKNAESFVYTQQIEAKTKPVINIEFGMTYHFFTRFYVSSGFQFTQLVTQIHPKWDKMLSEQNPYYNGLSQRVQRQLEYEAIGYNYQNVLYIPFSLGVEIYNSKRFDLAVETGFVHNVYTYSKGVILDDIYKLHYYSEYSGNPYKNFGNSWQNSIIFTYKLANNYSLFLKPSFTERKISYEFSSIDIQEIFNVYNIEVGFKYKI